MYFKSRADAGKVLAEQLAKKYNGQDCAVVALSDGGVMVGAQIAMLLHCVLTMLLTDAIQLPRENVAVAGINQDGSFSYNNYYSPGEIEEFAAEYHSLIEQEKLSKMQDLRRLLGKGGMIKKSLLRDRNVILVSDGLPSGFSLDLASEFLKPLRIKRLIVATPLASVPAVDRMHVLADEIYCLSVLEDYISTEHYYEIQDVPTHEAVVKTIEQIVGNWK
ncbi:MAG TPA: phosphoribosyltransferase family protein [Candidatus Saccharimonadales bacterium]|nr:phosphoribosyltransferase family protein [Candidatus Saccharimonadales bacterium]